MSDFSNGMALGLANALPNAIQKLMMLGPQIENARQQGMLRGAQAALNQAKQATEAQNLDLIRRTSKYWSDNYGDGYALVRPTTGADAQKALAFEHGYRQAKAVDAAFPVGRPRESNLQLVESMRNAGANAIGSFSENAGATPPISAFRGGVAQPAPEPAPVDNRQYLENLKNNINWMAKVNGSMQGRPMERAIGNTGVAIDPYTGETEVANEQLNSLYTTDKNLGIQNKQSIIANRGQIMKRRAATPIRGTGGGHHHKRRSGGGRGRGGSVYVEEQRHGVWGQRNTRTNHFTAYPKSMQEGGKSLIDLIK